MLIKAPYVRAISHLTKITEPFYHIMQAMARRKKCANAAARGNVAKNGNRCWNVNVAENAAARGNVTENGNRCWNVNVAENAAALGNVNVAENRAVFGNVAENVRKRHHDQLSEFSSSKKSYKPMCTMPSSSNQGRARVFDTIIFLKKSFVCFNGRNSVASFSGVSRYNAD